MTKMDLDRIEAGLPEQGRACGEVPHDALDVRRAGLPCPLHGQRAEDGRGREAAQSSRGCNGAGVADLGGDGGPLGVHGIGELAKSGHC